jgi:hypothetical protein
LLENYAYGLFCVVFTLNREDMGFRNPPSWTTQMTGLRQNLVYPVAQNLVATFVGAAAMLLYHTVASASISCPEGVIREAVRGEDTLISGSILQAARIADDLIVAAPECACGYELSASANLALMQSARLVHKDQEAETYRVACFRSIAQAIELDETSPRLSALRDACKA